MTLSRLNFFALSSCESWLCCLDCDWLTIPFIFFIKLSFHKCIYAFCNSHNNNIYFMLKRISINCWLNVCISCVYAPACRIKHFIFDFIYFTYFLNKIQIDFIMHCVCIGLRGMKYNSACDYSWLWPHFICDMCETCVPDLVIWWAFWRHHPSIRILTITVRYLRTVRLLFWGETHYAYVHCPPFAMRVFVSATIVHPASPQSRLEIRYLCLAD